MNTKWVVILEADIGVMLCEGIYNNCYEAIGHAMESITELTKDYSGKQGHSFDISPVYELDGDGGYGITVRYTDSIYTEPDKEKWAKDSWYILSSTEEGAK